MKRIRDDRIDVMRGIAILLVVLQHSIGSSNIVGKSILAFHMPLFFVISGYLAKPLGGGYSGFLGAVVKNIRNLLIPQVTLALITWLYNVLISYLILNQPNEQEFNPLYCFAGWWFLLVLFQVSLLWEIIRRGIGENKTARWVIGGLFVICLVYTLLIPAGIRGPLYSAVTPTAFMFYLIGYGCKRLDLRKYEIPIVAIPILVIVLCGLSYFNNPIFMYSNTYGYPVVFMMTSVIGAALIYAVSKYFEENRFLIYCGVNSIYIYIIHLKVRVAIGMVVSHFGVIPFAVQRIIIFAVTCIITLCGCVICKKYFWFLFEGKKPVVANLKDQNNVRH